MVSCLKKNMNKKSQTGNFLTYVSEPAQLERYSIGLWVMIFLVFFAFITYLLKIEYWRDIK